MKLRFSESDIVVWAAKYQYPLAETELIDLRASIQNAGCLSKEQLRLVARWKSPRSAGHIERNSESYIHEITEWSFHSTEERSRVEVLTLLDGVRWPSATVILHLFNKEPYPILDFRALWSVGKDVPNQYSFNFWWEYADFCRDLANRNGLDMRTLDRALWQYSKENQEV
jgi:hypothetical protein